ncbi:TRM11 family SAM-dependent methyltransferase [Caloramator proteoclasticus]|uniref:tRNA G10 N-methylase Trm11 n=1 Tax=Caloramator proteoclasticus DSM 10124 TaxID=1121262 RepID=A0A1M4V5L8_9CLOT|nr:methyltransferase domain-containing protein [Caloramator proteoclasticus]SHE64219.1 tRNA G10 N-methylase Trm11 [Caloramator proteoclasticus DSM 10124]
MFLYYINYRPDESDLCNLEMRVIFNKDLSEKYFLSEKDFDIDRSVFIKYKIDILASSNSFDELIKKVEKLNINQEKYKVKYFDVDDKVKVEFNEKHRLEGIIGERIEGDVDVYNPKVMFALTLVDGTWIFGRYIKNSGEWHKHEHKPVYYCNALPVRIARSMLNIGLGDNLNKKVVDPCCGVGTVLLEAAALSVDIEGYDINDKVVENAVKNIEFFGYDVKVENKDIANVDKKYDLAIIDLPYGILSITSDEEIMHILKSAARITKEAVIAAVSDIRKELDEAGFKVVDYAVVPKKHFKRFIFKCILK